MNSFPSILFPKMEGLLFLCNVPYHIISQIWWQSLFTSIKVGSINIIYILAVFVINLWIDLAIQRLSHVRVPVVGTVYRSASRTGYYILIHLNVLHVKSISMIHDWYGVYRYLSMVWASLEVWLGRSLFSESRPKMHPAQRYQCNFLQLQ